MSLYKTCIKYLTPNSDLKNDGGGGSGTGTTNYNDLSNKPKINGVMLSSDKTNTELGLGGLRADYVTKYGIIECPNGLIEYSVLDRDIMIKNGIQLLAWDDGLKTLIASDTPYEVLSDRDITLFYVDGDFLECDVYWQIQEPEDGSDVYLAWWNGTAWRFKSNDTGNVWRTPDKATPIADLHINQGVINRIDYVGYRLLNDEIYITNEQYNSRLEQVDLELEILSNDLEGLGNQITTCAFTNKDNNFSTAQTINGNITINGDIIQNGEVLNNKFITLTQAEYEALSVKDENTFYFITEN